MQSNTENRGAALYREIAGLGVVCGAPSGDAIAFRGIPYAASPTGPRRFAPPSPPSAWDSVRDATQIAPIAPQLASRADAVMGPIEGAQDEDCLSLTIWTPAAPVKSAPVIVWFHGGGFLTGGGALPWYDGSILAARHNMIVVGVNYRLGPLGFHSIPGAVPGNLAILDQQAALAWVQCHIAAFGGDPFRVTVMGESGGAHNIASLLTLDSAPLFRRAILQSAPLGIGLASPEEAQKRAEAWLTELGLSVGTDDLVERLRAVPLAELLQAQGRAGAYLAGQALGDLRPPVLPSEAAPHSVDSAHFVPAAATGAAKWGIELLIGWNRDEVRFFLGSHPAIAAATAEAADALAFAAWGDEARGVMRHVRARLPDASPGEHFIDAVNEVNFRAPALALADELANRGGRAFVYQFDWESPDPALGACHCLELPFVFGSQAEWSDSRMLSGADDAEVARLSEDIRRCWAGFAATGDPGFPGWTSDERPIRHLDVVPWLEVKATGDGGVPHPPPSPPSHPHSNLQGN